jgi:lysophospholipase L1-like esterase
LVNRAVPGSRAADGVQEARQILGRLLFPQLVVVAFGVNDQTLRRSRRTGRTRPRTTAKEFERQILSIQRTVKSRLNADVALIAPCEPNPDWEGASGLIPEYRDSLHRISESSGSTLIDVTTLWQYVRHEQPDVELLENQINHPNDIGHWLYALALTSASPTPS